MSNTVIQGLRLASIGFGIMGILAVGSNRSLAATLFGIALILSIVRAVGRQINDPIAFKDVRAFGPTLLILYATIGIIVFLLRGNDAVSAVIVLVGAIILFVGLMWWHYARQGNFKPSSHTSTTSLSPREADQNPRLAQRQTTPPQDTDAKS